MKIKFEGDFAVYKGKTYYVDYYAGGTVKLYDTADSKKENPLFTLDKSELDDSYFLFARAIKDKAEYIVKAVDKDTVYYLTRPGRFEKSITAQRPMTDFDIVYSEKAHGKYCEREILYINEERTDKSAAGYIFYADEWYEGALQFGVLEDIIPPEEFYGILKDMYGDRLGGAKGSDWHDLLSTVTIDGNDIHAHTDWGIVTVCSDTRKGNEYILEIAENFRTMEKTLAGQKKIKSVVVI